MTIKFSLGGMVVVTRIWNLKIPVGREQEGIFIGCDLNVP